MNTLGETPKPRPNRNLNLLTDSSLVSGSIPGKHFLWGPSLPWMQPWIPFNPFRAFHSGQNWSSPLDVTIPLICSTPGHIHTRCVHKHTALKVTYFPAAKHCLYQRVLPAREGYEPERCRGNCCVCIIERLSMPGSQVFKLPRNHLAHCYGKYDFRD